MKHYFKTLFLILVIATITFSCQKQDEVITKTNQYRLPSIETARHYFNEKANLGTLESIRPDRSSGNQNFLNLDWDKSKSKKFKDEPQEAIDILYTPIYLPTEGNAKGFIGTVEINGELQSKIIMLLYTQSNNKEAFSGFMLIYNLDGNIEYSYKYLEGQRIAEGLPSLTNNNRTNGDDCESAFESVGCFIDWIGGDWFGIDGYMENDEVVVLAVGDSSTGGGGYVNDSDFGNPSIEIPMLNDDASGPNGIPTEPWWLANTVSANPVSIAMALELEHVALPEAEWLLNEATQEQLTAIANFLNDNRVIDKNTVPEGFENNGIDQNQVTEISQEALDTALELINFLILNQEASYELLDTTLPSDALNFNSFSEADNYFNNLETNNSTHISTIFEANSIRKDTRSIHVSSFPVAKLVATIKVMVPDDNNDLECLNILNARVQFEGNNTLFDWVQFDSENPLDANGPLIDIQEDSDYLAVHIEGELIVGFKIAGFPVRGKRLKTVVISYVYSTSELRENHCCYFFNTNWADNNND